MVGVPVHSPARWMFADRVRPSEQYAPTGPVPPRRALPGRHSAPWATTGPCARIDDLDGPGAELYGSINRALAENRLDEEVDAIVARLARVHHGARSPERPGPVRPVASTARRSSGESMRGTLACPEMGGTGPVAGPLRTAGAGSRDSLESQSFARECVLPLARPAANRPSLGPSSTPAVTATDRADDVGVHDHRRMGTNGEHRVTHSHRGLLRGSGDRAACARTQASRPARATPARSCRAATPPVVQEPLDTAGRAGCHESTNVAEKLGSPAQPLAAMHFSRLSSVGVRAGPSPPRASPHGAPAHHHPPVLRRSLPYCLGLTEHLTTLVIVSGLNRRTRSHKC